MSKWATRGAWHITMKIGAGAETDYSCDVEECEHVEGGRSKSTTIPACGTVFSTTGPPEDAIKLTIAHDLAANSLYTWLETHDGEAATVWVWPDLADAPTVVYEHHVTLAAATPDTLSATKTKTATVTIPLTSRPLRKTKAVPTSAVA